MHVREREKKCNRKQTRKKNRAQGDDKGNVLDFKKTFRKGEKKTR